MKRLLAALAIVSFAALMPGSANAGLEKEVDPSITDGSAAKRLGEAEVRWQDAGIERYWFRISASCFCPQRDPVDIVVTNGKPVASDPDWFGPKTVPQLFDYVGEAIAGKAAQLDVTYRKQDGVPTAIYVDRDKLMVDEEMSFRVTGFTDLDESPGPGPVPAGGAANRKQAVAITRKRIRTGSQGRSWKRGTKRSIRCRPTAGVFVCVAKWTHKGKAHTERVLVRRKSAA